ncbi:MAG TPA: redoxin domain-containing protein [Cryomorphaceae bacterium]|nr:redoxin domain-containing protein [Cryomorphaceae bacterium]
MLKNLLITFVLLIQIGLHGQLPDGSTAPDFTLTDYYGAEHNLYAYLDADKTVILKIFAAHCPACWNYHQTDRLKNLYTDYGPDGTNELMVLALEHDQWNSHNAFIGVGDPWVTQGNWLEGTPFPIFNVEDPDRGVFDEYNVTGYPVVYKICPDGITERIFTNETENQIYEKAQDCPAALSIDAQQDIGSITFDSHSRNLNIDRYQKVNTVRIMSITGQIVQTINAIDSPAFSINPLAKGIYLFEIQTDYGRVVKRFYVN